MGLFSQFIAQIFRDYETDGDSSSGTHKLIKSEVRAWGLIVETTLTQALTPEGFGAVGDGSANDTAALVALFAASPGNRVSFKPGATYLTDPVVISQTNANAPMRIDGNGAKLKARASSANPLLTIENVQGLLTTFVVSDLKLNANGLHAQALKIHGSQHAAFRDIEATGGAAGGVWLSGEPGFGIYYTTFDSINSHDNTGAGFIFKSINNTGNYYIAAENMLGLRSINNTTYGYDIDYASFALYGSEAELNTLGAFNLDHTIQASVYDCHIEANGGTQIAFIGTANTKNLHVRGGRAIGTITASLLTDVSNSWDTADVNATPIKYIAGNRFVSGLQMGAPTGGDKGVGTINVASGVFLNNTSYTNPDYALEHFFTGEIRRFIQNPGAKNYRGLMQIDALREHLKSKLRLPGILDEPTDIFTRADIVLEKLEEAMLYIINLHERIAALEAKK